MTTTAGTVSSGGAWEAWPELPYERWRDTCTTLHLWTQIVGKVRVASTPWVNHSWHVPLYLTARGLTTSPMPFGQRTFEISFDFIDHRLLVHTSDGQIGALPLVPRSVADFYHHLMAQLGRMGLHLEIHGSPNEVAEPIPFALDELHGSYDTVQANRFWRVVASSGRVLQDFRGEFLGKCSPVHFFWGSFDLAVTRFSGRGAPTHPGGIPNLPDWITREAYSHEVSSAGFWPGGEMYPHPIFYSYAYPTPDGLADRAIRPAGASWEPTLSEFVYPYETMRTSASPEEDLMNFLRSTYAATADVGGWDRGALEWGAGERPPTGLRDDSPQA